MIRVLLISILISTASAARSSEIGVAEFLRLDSAEQDRIFVASYNTAKVLLAFGGVGFGDSKLGLEKMAACLREREVDWLRRTFAEYVEHVEKYRGFAKEFGATFAQSLAWQCGLLTFEGQN